MGLESADDDDDDDAPWDPNPNDLKEALEAQFRQNPDQFRQNSDQIFGAGGITCDVKAVFNMSDQEWSKWQRKTRAQAQTMQSKYPLTPLLPLLVQRSQGK